MTKRVVFEAEGDRVLLSISDHEPDRIWVTVRSRGDTADTLIADISRSAVVSMIGEAASHQLNQLWASVWPKKLTSSVKRRARKAGKR